MRLFLAIPLPRKYVQKLTAYQGRVDLKDSGRFVPSRNLHVTVFFLGEVDKHRIPELSTELEKIAKTLPGFDLSFAKVELRPPKMIWACFQFTSGWRKFWQAIAKVARSFAEKSFDRKKQLPHITLARLKSAFRLEVPDLELAPLSVDRIEIWQSELSPQGALYTSLAGFPLQQSFAEKVYEIVRQIPKGEVRSYAEVAELAGSPRAVRAVGNILKQNFDPKIPCHRVIRSDGETGEYNRGAGKKVRLLRKEGAIIPRD